mmetsp:Transcript_22725/g.56067  ORF Transcript_22725/g.56067 Transcript_22725/m.56067 type:complete len:363 (-) Transcript_22725:188-1276(-)
MRKGSRQWPVLSSGGRYSVEFHSSTPTARIISCCLTSTGDIPPPSPSPLSVMGLAHASLSLVWLLLLVDSLPSLIAIESHRGSDDGMLATANPSSSVDGRGMTLRSRSERPTFEQSRCEARGSPDSGKGCGRHEEGNGGGRLPLRWVLDGGERDRPSRSFTSRSWKMPCVTKTHAPVSLDSTSDHIHRATSLARITAWLNVSNPPRHQPCSVISAGKVANGNVLCSWLRVAPRTMGAEASAGEGLSLLPSGGDRKSATWFRSPRKRPPCSWRLATHSTGTPSSSCNTWAVCSARVIGETKTLTILSSALVLPDSLCRLRYLPATRTCSQPRSVMEGSGTRPLKILLSSRYDALFLDWPCRRK